MSQLPSSNSVGGGSTPSTGSLGGTYSAALTAKKHYAIESSPTFILDTDFPSLSGSNHPGGGPSIHGVASASSLTGGASGIAGSGLYHHHQQGKNNSRENNVENEFPSLSTTTSNTRGVQYAPPPFSLSSLGPNGGSSQGTSNNGLDSSLNLSSSLRAFEQHSDYTLMGLLDVIRMNDADLSTFALGLDFAGLQLDLASNE